MNGLNKLKKKKKEKKKKYNKIIRMYFYVWLTNKQYFKNFIKVSIFFVYWFLHKLIVQLILLECQPIKGYFMPWD